MEHKTQVGSLLGVPNHKADTGMDYFFELENGEFLTVKFSGGYADARTVPLNTKIALCMLDATVDGFHIICDHQPLYRMLVT